MMPHDFLLSHVARILAEDDWFAAHRVRIIRQDSADLGEELAKSGAEVDGVSLVVAYDRETSIASSPRQFEVEFSLLAAEFCLMMRTRCSANHSSASRILATWSRR